MRLILAILLCLIGATAAGAQTATPTPTPTPAWDERFPLPQVLPLKSPTPIPVQPTPDFGGSIVLPLQDIYVILATADGALAAAPGDLSRPGGVPIVPAERGEDWFSYAKWLISYSTADELFDPLAPIVQHVATIFVVIVAFVGIAFVLILVVFIVRFVVWIVRLVLEFIPG